MDDELFELCKEVYKKTKLDEKKDYLFVEDSFHITHPEWDEIEVAHHDMGGRGIPLYTSDYLLEKLPRSKRNSFDELTLQKDHTIGWRAGYPSDLYEDDTWYDSVNADTPLKALLKLVLALEKAGEL